MKKVKDEIVLSFLMGVPNVEYVRICIHPYEGLYKLIGDVWYVEKHNAKAVSR